MMPRYAIPRTAHCDGGALPVTPAMPACQGCKGTGKMPGGQTCRDCGGTGIKSK